MNSESNPSVLCDPPKRSRKLYERIEKAICDRISDGTLKPGDRLARIEELSREMEASVGTVRHSLQNLAARGILVRRPRAGAFVASAQSSLLADQGTRISNAVTLMLPDISHPEFALLSRDVQDIATEMKLDVIICSTDDEIDRYEQMIQRQIKSNVYGIIMIPPSSCNLPLSLLSEIQSSGTPVVSIFRPVPATGWPTVLTDYQYGIGMSTRHLLETGCRNIAFANINETPSIMHRKHYAFLRTLIQSHHPPGEELLLTVPPTPLTPTPESRQEQKQLLRHWLMNHPQVDGICCVHDELASQVMIELRELGRKVPEEVAVSGCGGFAAFYGLEPNALTTIDPQHDQIAAAAFDLLRQIRSGVSVPHDTEVMIKGKLIVGDSTRRSDNN